MLEESGRRLRKGCLIPGRYQFSWHRSPSAGAVCGEYWGGMTKKISVNGQLYRFAVGAA
ncbi:hypothetical protein KCP69_26595 (plasmid) [Salmonella enterica subsp. enterica]|nr:hypothetical protein KCP69_26595 [Salmonella enterica subsp. enterica]